MKQPIKFLTCIIIGIVVGIVMSYLLTPILSQYRKKQTIYGSGFEITSCNQITEKDIYKLCLKVRNKDPEEFEVIMMTNKFHGHIGPNNVYGAKMGLYAKKLLEGKNHEVRVISETGTKRPISCLNDGIMVALGNTVGWGKDLLQVPELAQGKLAATFYYKDKSVRLEVKPEKLAITQKFIKDSLDKHGGLTDDYFNDVRKMGVEVWGEFPKEDLFAITYPTQKGYYCDSNEININSYFNRLHSFLHTGPTNEEILEFVDIDKCVRDGNVEKKEDHLEVGSTWESNGERLIFTH